ncbi:MAG: thiolase family protein [Deltaproteobacteria bacterium]|nr:thiolase family protein [Deltaproteobacteria bacterium]
MKECVIVDGLRTPNGRAHKDKGWFRNKRPDELITAVYDALFERNRQVKPEDVEAVFIGTAIQIGMQNDIGRLGWLAGGYPESVPSNTICQQCPSGMSAVEHAARAIMCGEGDIYIAGGVEDMLHAPMGVGMDIPPRVFQKYSPAEIPMGATAEKVADQWNVSRRDMETMAYYSNKRAAAARDAGKFKNEIVSVEGEKEDGTQFMVDRDQWIRDDISMETMAEMKSPFKEGGVITAATSSPLTQGACALLLMSREKADEFGCAYHLKYMAGVMAGCDPSVMGIGPVFAVKKLLERTGISINEIDVVEINEAFASQSLVCLRELGLEKNSPFEKTNLWGGALALGHPLGESGARIVVTLNNIMKTERTDAKYGLATLCGGFGNANATLWERVG